MNKKTMLSWMTAAVLMTTACGGAQQKNEVADSTSTDSAIVINDRVTQFYDSKSQVTVLGLQDKATVQSFDLFEGSYNDSLLATLLPEEGARSSINVFLVKFPGGPNVLFDAGLGGEEGFVGLKQFKPEEINAVCLTHLHPDHINGLLQGDEAAFPNATLYLSEKENASVEQWDAESPLLATWVKIKKAYEGKIETFADNEMLFEVRVRTIPAPGHTPGHTVFQVGTCVIAGDIVHSQDLQIKYPDFCARYDQDPTTAVASRKQILRYVRNNGLTLCGAHCYEHFIKL